MVESVKEAGRLRVVRSSSNEPRREAGPAIGARVRETRKTKGWSLARLSSECQIPQSTLSKFETDNLSLPLDRIFRVADSLGISIGELFDRSSVDSGPPPGRRSISRAGDGRVAATATYARRWLFPELIQKRMFPIIQEILAREMSEFGPLLRHEGEEFSLVLRGQVQFVTDIYEPIVLGEMEGVYIDSRMGHAYLNVGTGEATILNVCTGAELTSD